MKTALITGISGQDGAYLAQLLLQKGYKVIGLSRQTDRKAFHRLTYLGIEEKVILDTCDLAVLQEVIDFLETHKPDEIYNLAAQSSVGQSFQFPQETFTFNTLSVMNLLEGIRRFDKKIRFYQASSSEMFGNVSLQNLPIKESLLFHPASPYGISKASAHWLAVNYREAYGLFTACGILFNHESALRGENFVIKKIINTAVQIRNGEAEELTVGNLAISRDWGYAPKYVEAMWRMLQKDSPSDYVICSGQVTSLLELLNQVFLKLDLDLRTHIRIDPNLLRSLDLAIIYGDNAKAKQELDWEYEMDTLGLISKLIEDEKDWMNWKKTRFE
ncbi:GDPmannose 4,6-dehydratase [Algoriphagus ornithinivorans]|uniref:GDP-mannose 4,6-dehydratase n=1 Tax=Algoriphagus ornithinivorans TaxID=226506 RepID=A0A1I5JNF9_9BACT|nr:GDP-mannose 4,6-dehydratase [Algoriphagus ornithinivorans]SFO74259.1 GDPmannose 4,6-dehydratase [Algoriphagus ornithinivorans]